MTCFNSAYLRFVHHQKVHTLGFVTRHQNWAEIKVVNVDILDWEKDPEYWLEENMYFSQNVKNTLDQCPVNMPLRNVRTYITTHNFFQNAN
jgi:hypothetical protein